MCCAVKVLAPPPSAEARAVTLPGATASQFNLVRTEASSAWADCGAGGAGELQGPSGQVRRTRRLCWEEVAIPKQGTESI